MDNQTLKIIDRNSVELNNAKKVISFNTNEFLIDTPYGNLKITGKNLSIGKMDTEKQDLIIKGTIDSHCLSSHFSILFLWHIVYDIL